MTTRANIVDRDQIKEALERLGSTDDKTNWVMMGYGEGKNDIVFLGSGEGGLEEFKTLLTDDKIYFCVFEVVVEGDGYNPIKRVLLSWIGKEVPPGLHKARAAGHKNELIEFITESVSISSEYETAKIAEINFDTIAQSLTRIRPTYATTNLPGEEHKEMSHSKGIHGVQSRMVVVNEDEALAGLKAVFEGSAEWATLAYVEGKRDEVEFLEVGHGGLEALKERFPKDRIIYAMFTVKIPTMGKETVTKYILLSLVGPQVKPLQKARSGGQRQEVQEFIKKVLPVNAHYQPGGPNDLNLSTLLTKFV